MPVTTGVNRYSLAAGAAALAILLASCSSSKKNAPDTTAPAGTTTSATAPSSAAGPSAPAAGGIVISGFAYSGALTVKPGEKVTVTNKDSVAHTLTDVGGKFDTGNIDGSGATGTFTAPTAPGSYQLKCTYHPQMKGTLVVKA
jgi:plastocyanin